MLTRFLMLEWKSFTRAASFQANLLLKTLMVFGVLSFVFVLGVLGVSVYYILTQMELDPFSTVNRYLLYYLLADLMLRFFLQKAPVMNTWPLLVLPVSKNSILYYTLGKSALSYFNWMHAFFLVPFAVVLLREGFAPSGVLGWFLGVFALLFANNFLNILSANKNSVLYLLGILFCSVAGLHYFAVVDVTHYTQPLFDALYSNPVAALVPVLFLAILATGTFLFYKKNLYLDTGLSGKQDQAETQHFHWLNRFGSLSTFLKNDLRLLLRNKRSRTTIIISAVFLLYGLLFFSGGMEAYEGPVWRIFAGLFVTGGFLFTFGQYVPSWDSAYYPLMMSQNIPYRQYLNAKWWLMVIATVASTLLASFYLYFGWEVYMAILVGGIYNIGVNAHIVLWAGAYIKTPIDLSKNKNVFGDKQAFTIKSVLLSIPKLVLPMVLYGVGHYLHSPGAGYLLVALTGVLGFAFKGKVFQIVETIYKKEKYKTLAAYRQKN